MVVVQHSLQRVEGSPIFSGRISETLNLYQVINECPFTTSFPEVRNRKEAEGGLLYHWTAYAVLASLSHHIWFIEHKGMEVTTNEFLNNDTIIHEGLLRERLFLWLSPKVPQLLGSLGQVHNLAEPDPRLGQTVPPQWKTFWRVGRFFLR